MYCLASWCKERGVVMCARREEIIEKGWHSAGRSSKKNSKNVIGPRKREGTARKDMNDDQRNSQHQKGSPIVQLVSQSPSYTHHLSSSFLSSLSSVVVPRLPGLTGSPPPNISPASPALAFAFPFAAFLLLCASGNRSFGRQLGSGEKAGCSTGSLDPRGGENGRFLA